MKSPPRKARERQKICDVPLLDFIMNYQPPLDETEEKRVSVKHIPTCYDVSLLRLVKRAKAKGKTNATKKIVTMCAIAWGMPKFQSIDVCHELINTRQNKALSCETEEEKLLFLNSKLQNIFGDVISDKTPKVKLPISEADFDYISSTAATLKMTGSDLTLLFYFIGINTWNR